jgi:hypothetical protein
VYVWFDGMRLRFARKRVPVKMKSEAVA